MNLPELSNLQTLNSFHLTNDLKSKCTNIIHTFDILPLVKRNRFTDSEFENSNLFIYFNNFIKIMRNFSRVKTLIYISGFISKLLTIQSRKFVYIFYPSSSLEGKNQVGMYSNYDGTPKIRNIKNQVLFSKLLPL